MPDETFDTDFGAGSMEPAAEPQEPIEAPALEPDGAGQEPAPQPSYVEQGAFDSAIAGMASDSNKRSQNINQQIQELRQMMVAQNQRRQQPRQERTPVIPDYRQFAEMDQLDLHSTLSKMTSAHQTEMSAMRKQLGAVQQQVQRNRYEREFHAYVTGQTDQAVRENGKVFKSPEMKSLLQHQVAAHIQASGGDLNRVNIPEIARNLGKLFTTEAGRMYQEKIAPSGRGSPSSKVPSAPGSAPVKGTGSRPRVAPKEMKTMDDFGAGLEAQLTQMAQNIQDNQG